jgi:hypothetical protein
MLIQVIFLFLLFFKLRLSRVVSVIVTVIAVTTLNLITYNLISVLQVDPHHLEELMHISLFFQAVLIADVRKTFAN